MGMSGPPVCELRACSLGRAGHLERLLAVVVFVCFVVHAGALNMGAGRGGVWITGCVDCDQHRDTFFAQEIDTEANAPAGPRFAVDGVGFGPLLVGAEFVVTPAE
jgi:hypothetical protein